jgi:Peptidase inhibitor family I36
MSALPTVGAQDLSSARAGYYRVPRALSAPVGTAPAMTVYWMPSGTAERAPSEIKALPAYRDDAALGLLGSSDVTFFGPDAASVDPPVGVLVACPGGWMCVYQHSSWGGAMRQFQSTGPWQHLSDYGFNDETSSVRNTRGNDSLLSDDIDGNENPGGTIRCFDSHSSTSGLGSFNDEASGVFNSTLDTRC